MPNRKGKRVALYLPQALAAHIETARDWRSASEYIRKLIEADMAGATAPHTRHPLAQHRAPPKPRQAITPDYVRAVIEWKHGDAAAGLIAENAAHYPSEADWLVPVFAETPTFAGWRDAMEAETKNPAD